MRLLILVIGALLLFGGAFTAMIFRYIPPPAPAYWILPHAVVLLAFSVLWLRWGWRIAIYTFMGMGAAAYLVNLQVWPGAVHINGQEPPPTTQANERFLPGSAGRRVQLQIPDQFRVSPFLQPRELRVPAGFRISVYAAGLGDPRMLVLGPGGDIYVSLPGEGRILVLPDADKDGVADRVEVYAEGLTYPHGLAFIPDGLLVAEPGRVLLLTDADGDLKADQAGVFIDHLPDEGGHRTRSLAVGPGGDIYVAIGSSCNVCVEDDPRRGAILKFKQRPSRGVRHASGLRNAVGLAFHSQTGDLWASENGRDMLADDLPPDEINRVVEGGDYGWPFCFGDRRPDPAYSDADRCSATMPAAVELPAHVAPLGLTFGFGLSFPPPFRHVLYVALHGSWNRTVPVGYKLVGIPFDEGRPVGPPVDMVSGWLEDGSAWGRPVAPLVGADGALYISDDRAGAIYRLASEGPGQSGPEDHGAGVVK